MSCIDVTLPPPPRSGKLLLVVAAALIDADGRVLLAQRPEGKPMAGLWEFPGGKIGNGETPEDALCRELHEELDVQTQPACLFPAAFASHAYDEFHLMMPLYICRQWQGVVQPKEGQKIAWVKPADLGNYTMPPADVPLVSALRTML
jgi:8-oxo-dGTP diphosphatase